MSAAQDSEYIGPKAFVVPPSHHAGRKDALVETALDGVDT
jgi:hypothetical protein